MPLRLRVYRYFCLLASACAWLGALSLHLGRIRGCARGAGVVCSRQASLAPPLRFTPTPLRARALVPFPGGAPPALLGSSFRSLQRLPQRRWILLVRAAAQWEWPRSPCLPCSLAAICCVVRCPRNARRPSPPPPPARACVPPVTDPRTTWPHTSSGTLFGGSPPSSRSPTALSCRRSP